MCILLLHVRKELTILKILNRLQYVSYGYGMYLELVKFFQVRLFPSCFD